MTATQYADTLTRLATNRDAAQERAIRAATVEERRDAARTVAFLEDDIRALRAKRVQSAETSARAGR